MTLPSQLLLLLLLAPQLCRAQNYIVTENARTGDGNWAARVNSADGIEAYSTVSSASPGEDWGIDSHDTITINQHNIVTDYVCVL